MKTCQGETSERLSNVKDFLASRQEGEHKFGSEEELSHLYQWLFSSVCRDTRVPLAALVKIFLSYFGRPVV